MAVSGCIYGAPGEIRTPDLVVRSHASVFAFTSVIIELFYNRCPNHFTVWVVLDSFELVSPTLIGIVELEQFDYPYGSDIDKTTQSSKLYSRYFLASLQDNKSSQPVLAIVRNNSRDSS